MQRFRDILSDLNLLSPAQKIRAYQRQRSQSHRMRERCRVISMPVISHIVMSRADGRGAISLLPLPSKPVSICLAARCPAPAARDVSVVLAMYSYPTNACRFAAIHVAADGIIFRVWNWELLA